MKNIIYILFFSLIFNWNFYRVKSLIYENYFITKNNKFVQESLTECEINKFFQHLHMLDGIIYKEGGNKPEEGLDCSGLIVYLYNKIGCKWFRDSTFLVNDISADKICRWNVKMLTDINLLKPGDFIFLDSNGNNVIEHVSIFSCIDNRNNLWVWDATDFPDGKIVNKVSHRKINNLFDKNPSFGRPLKTYEERPFLSFLAFP